MDIKPNGYYGSYADILKDWHSGSYIIRHVYISYWFKANHKLLVATQTHYPHSKKGNDLKYEGRFNQQEFSNSKAQSSYVVEGDTLIIFDQEGKVYDRYAIRNPDLLIDQRGFKYRFKKWEE